MYPGLLFGVGEGNLWSGLWPSDCLGVTKLFRASVRDFGGGVFDLYWLITDMKVNARVV